jgi:hypothetical protein
MEPMGSSGGRPPVMVAIEVVVLWPQGVGAEPVSVDEAGLWPAFVLVIGEHSDLSGSSAGPLFDLLDSSRHADGITVVGGSTDWSVVDPRHALLRLTVRARVPVRFEADILLPAERVLGILDVVAGGGTIGLTTHRHAVGLDDRVDVRTALRNVVLLSCSPSPELRAHMWQLFGMRS